jgi:hypothetical protein
MANYNEALNPNRVPDAASLGGPAQNDKQRIAALQWCLANDWAGLDIGKLERSDTPGFHGWLMCPYVNG